MDRTDRSAPPNQEEPSWNASHTLDVYILDYFKKRNLHETIATFKHECKVFDKPCAVEAPSGFLFEWWSIFWDIYISRTNPSFSECASTYSKAQKAKIPIRQQQLQQQVQQQQQHLMLQQQLVAKLRQESPGIQPFQDAYVTGHMEEAGRGGGGNLPSASLKGGLDLQQRQQLLAAFQASKLSANQANIGPGPVGEQLRGAGPHTPLAIPTPLASPTPTQPSAQSNKRPGLPHALMHGDAFQPSPAPLLSPNTFPPDMRQQAIQKLQLQCLHDQQQQPQQQEQQHVAQQGDLHRGKSAELSGQRGSSWQSSGTLLRHSQSPTMPAQQQPQQQALDSHHMMRYHMRQQHSDDSMSGQLHVPQGEEQKRLLAHISSRGMLRSGCGVHTGSSLALSGQGIAASPDTQIPLRAQQQQHAMAELERAHQQQQVQQQHQQTRTSGRLGMLTNTHTKLEPGVGQQQTSPKILEMERQMPSCDLGQNRDSPANSTAAGSLQTGRATPTPISSSVHKTSRPRGAKLAHGTRNKKRKHSTSTSPSISGSQEAPSSNASGGSPSHKGSIKQAAPLSPLQHSMDQVTWGHTRVGSVASLLNTAGSGMNAAAAALNSSSDNILHEFIGNDGLLDPGLDPLLSLGGDGDPTDASVLSG